MNTPDANPMPVMVFPLFDQGKPVIDQETLVREKRKARALIRDNAKNPGVREMFNMMERLAAKLTQAGISPGSTPHDQGQAYGAIYVMNVIRTCLEADENVSGEGEA